MYRERVVRQTAAGRNRASPKRVFAAHPYYDILYYLVQESVC